ncbi:hypothetical protein CJ030_MR3G028961 [Morella rubra]|uniref:GRF-type domain-containing protein n=1 Tax=Morella rubra TaxID=262757 RepID=A0A6A1W8T1_9ROSI|nr:hypothetical protein CJ030_MR3G028961 [Morella rubra]
MASSFSASISSSAGSRPRGIWGGDDGHTEVELCDCGVAARPRTSMTEGNLGRHFYGCAHYGRASSQKPCNYFRWIEPPHRDEVCRLVRKVQSLEDMTRRQSVKEQNLKLCCVVHGASSLL